ncbi:MAG: outer membrane protein assembly factor BamD, partial [Planctomycetes bacterium]|nr:outer membrane protein assembly factor BamD [Planctomycetota bacterium]
MNRVGVSLFCLIVLCAPMCPAFAQEAAPATRENKIIALQQEASLYFESGQYELAFLSLDKLYTTSGIDQASEQLEEASLYKARCKYHLSQAANEPVTRKALLEEARQLFAHNLDKYPERRFYPANLYWQGRTLRDLASVSEDDEQRQNLVEASQQFSSAKPFLNGSDLKFDNSYYYAITMGEIGDLDPELPERNQIYAEAVMALEKLILNYPEHPQRSQAEFQLLRYLFKSQKYEQALDVCVRFQKKFPLDKKLTEVCFFGAESLYYVGRLMEAVEGYDK